MLLKKFKEIFKKELLNLHWRQWNSLGVSGQGSIITNWLIDLEAITSSTLHIGLLDKRLLTASLEWLKENRNWLNVSRFKKIQKYFNFFYTLIKCQPYQNKFLKNYKIF